MVVAILEVISMCPSLNELSWRAVRQKLPLSHGKTAKKITKACVGIEQ